MYTNSLLDGLQIVPAFGPATLEAAANNGDWVSLKGFEGCVIVFLKGAGTAGEDPVLTLRQAKDVSGTDAKALNFRRVLRKSGTLGDVGQFTEVNQEAANTYTSDTDAEVAALYALEVKRDMLDIDGDFDCIQFQIPDVGAAAQLGVALYLLYGPRYGGASMPGAIAD